jgi:hypothetical protein
MNETRYAFTNNRSSIRLNGFGEDYEGIDLLEEGTEAEIIKSARESNLGFVHWFERTEDDFGHATYNYVSTIAVR